MNLQVVTFFIFTTLATLLLGYAFVRRADGVFKHFGIGLLLNGVAFAIWSAVAVTRPESLEPYVTFGVAFFLASLVAYLASGIQNMEASMRRNVIIAGAVVAVAVFLLRMFVYPSQPGFSAEGLFFFGPHPVIQALEIFGLALVGLPAIYALAAKFTAVYSRLIQYGFALLIMSGVILIVSVDTTLLYIAGWVIGMVYFLLLAVLFVNKKAWTGVV